MANMLKKLKNWWKWNTEFEKNSADNPVTALSEHQRRNAGPLLALAFGWGFLVTGLFTGGLLGNGLPFWPDIVLASFLGNLVNFIIGASLAIIKFWNYFFHLTNYYIFIFTICCLT